MNDNSLQQDDFFDAHELDALDREIAEQIGRPTLVDQMQQQSDAEEARRMDWATEFKRHWFVYAFLLISAMFTGTLGIYMGLSPTLVTEASGLAYIHFNTDIGHVLLAVVYFIAFIGVTEFEFAVAKQKFHTREQKNQTQRWTMVVGMIVGALGILGTGIAGGTVVASNVVFLTEFANIPPAAQKWVVVAIPVLITIYTLLYSMYALSSEEAKSERLASENERKQNLDHRTRMRSIEQIAVRQLQVAEIMVYKQLVMQGKMSSAEAAAAIRAGHTLGQTEAHLGRDLNGDGQVGPRALPQSTTAFRPAPQENTAQEEIKLRFRDNLTPQPILQHAPRPEPSYHPRSYTLQEFLDLIGYSKAEAQAVLARNGDLGAEGAWNLLNQYSMIPLDMVFQNFQGLYAELFPTSTPRVQPTGANRNP